MLLVGGSDDQACHLVLHALLGRLHAVHWLSVFRHYIMQACSKPRQTITHTQAHLCLNKAAETVPSCLFRMYRHL